MNSHPKPATDDAQRSRIWWLVALVVVPLVALTGLLLWQQLRQAEERIAADRRNLAEAAALATEAFIQGNYLSARALALNTAFTDPKPGPALAAFMQGLTRENPDWDGLAVVGPNGVSIQNSRGGTPVDLSDRPYFRQALASGQPAVSAALIGRRSGKAAVIIAPPVEFVSGERGILVIPLPTDKFGAALIKRLGTRSVSITVVDHEGKTFIDPDPARVAALRPLRGTPEVDAVLRGQAGSSTGPFNGVESLIAYAPVSGYGWGVLLTEPVAAAFEPARAEARQQLMLFGLILLVVLLLAAHFGRRLAASMQRTQDALEAAERSSREAEAARLELQRTLETRDEFLAAASHDLRNPLSAISGAADLLHATQARAGSVPQERLADCVSRISAASRRMAALIDTFMDVARMQMGRPLELDVATTDLARLTREVIEEWRVTSSQHRLIINAPEVLYADIDGARMQRALSNLIGNAIKYSPDGGDVVIGLQQSAAEVRVSVSDRGVGIPEAELDRIFTRFSRGSNVSGRIPGTGIGLASSRQIVQEHGGCIEVESKVGRGTTMTIVLPGRLRRNLEPARKIA